MLFSTYKKTVRSWIVFSVVLLIITPFAYIPLPFTPAPQKVEAIGCAPIISFPSLEPQNVPEAQNGSGDIIAKSSKLTEDFKKCVLDPMGTIMAKTIIKSLTMSIVNWINSGFEGNPSFIQNPGSFFEGVADKVAGQAIERIAPLLCSPFKLNLTLMLALSYNGANASEDPVCTLTQVEQNVSNAATGVQNQANAIGDGGWKSFFNVHKNPNNDPDGALLKAQASMGLSISNANGKLALPLSWSGGFMGMQDCSDAEAQRSAAAMAQNATVSQAVGCDNNPEGCVNNGTTADSVKIPAHSAAYDEAKSGKVYGVDVNQDGCITKTPGAAISSQLSDVLGSDLRGLEVAQSLDQIFAALVGQLVKQALGGLGGLSGASGGQNSSAGSGNIDLNNLDLGFDLPPVPMTGSCSPSKDSVAVGEPVFWNAYVTNSVGGTVTYRWVGEGIEDQDAEAVTAVYSSFGAKSANLIVTRPQQTINGKDVPEEVRTFTCVPNINVGGQATTLETDFVPTPINGTESQVFCQVDKTTVGVNQPVTYTMTNNTQRLAGDVIGYRIEPSGFPVSGGTTFTEGPMTVTYSRPGNKTAFAVVQRSLNVNTFYGACPVVTVQ